MADLQRQLTMKLLAELAPHSNMLLGKIDGYDSTRQSDEKEPAIFGEVFTEGFAFEILDIIANPPNIFCKWKHSGRFSGQYSDAEGRLVKGDGRMIEVVGMCEGRVTRTQRIIDLQLHYDPDTQIKAFMRRPAKQNRFPSCALTPFNAGVCCEDGSDNEDELDEIEQTDPLLDGLPACKSRLTPCRANPLVRSQTAMAPLRRSL